MAGSVSGGAGKTGGEGAGGGSGVGNVMRAHEEQTLPEQWITGAHVSNECSMEYWILDHSFG